MNVAVMKHATLCGILNVIISSCTWLIDIEREIVQGLLPGAQRLPPNTLLADINKRRAHANLSPVIRLFVLDYYRQLAAHGLTVKQKPK
jgi:hypothetical protein